MTTTSLTSNAIHRKQAAPRTLGELLILFEYKMAREISRGSVTAKRDLSNARCTVKKLEEMHGVPARLIWLGDLVEIDQQLIAYLEGKGIVHQSAIQYVCNKDKLLEFAHARGWACKKFEFLQSWKPSRLALKGNTGGGLGIIDDAIAQGLRPCDYTWKHFLAWRQAQLKRGRSLLTVDTEQCHFRKRLRKAGLQKAFRRFALGSKNPSEYAAKLEDLPLSLRRDIEAVLKFKTAEYMAGRDAKLANRPPSVLNLRKALLQICGFVYRRRSRNKPTRLRQVITRENILPLIDWLIVNRKCKRSTITSRLSLIHYLACTHKLFAGLDYSWIRIRLNRIEREARHLRDDRKKQKYVRYDLLASIPNQIKEERLTNEQPGSVEFAWILHDLLFMSWPLHLPWRQRNLRELAIAGPGLISLVYEEIPTDRKHELELPGWASGVQKVWQYTFMASQTKGNRARWGLVPHELISLLEMYKAHRHLLIADEDPGTLFLNRVGVAMDHKDVLALVTRLTVRYIGTRVTPHLLRDAYAVNFLEKGGSIEKLQEELWHADIATTYEYCKRFGASQAVIALDEYFATIDPGRMLRS